MSASFLTYLLARDPRKLVRFPDPTLDQALAAWRAIKDTAEAPGAASPAPVAVESPSDDLDGPLADLATHVWRARHRLNDTAEPADALRRTSRHIDSAVESFRLLDLNFKDWINEPYDPGLPLKVLTFQPTAGITRDTVIEVVRPAVLWRGRLLQSGEVVVGTPQQSAT